MALIAVNLLVYLGTVAFPNWVNDYALAGCEIRLSPSCPPFVQTGQWYRLFTSNFIHLSVTHIALNMISLLIIGRLVEPVLGKWRYLALYLVAGFGSSVACYLLTSPNVGSAGASGAIFGLFGAFFVLARRAAANTSGIVVLIVINLVYSFSVPGISWQGHIGGLVTGLVVAAGFGLGRGRHQELMADVAVLACTCAALGLLMLLPPGVLNLG
jgi:membrane associated rhomboid family serine protease